MRRPTRDGGSTGTVPLTRTNPPNDRLRRFQALHSPLVGFFHVSFYILHSAHSESFSRQLP